MATQIIESLSGKSTEQAQKLLPKAYYRRAKARFEANTTTLEATFEDALTACKLAPMDSEARKLLDAVKQKQVEYNEKQKAELSGIFLKK
jgi:hypothetical protein